MTEVGVPHALIAHLQRIVVIGVDAVALTPGADALQQGAAAAGHLVEVLPHMHLECVVDDLLQCFHGVLGHIVVADDTLPPRVGYRHGYGSLLPSRRLPVLGAQRHEVPNAGVFRGPGWEHHRVAIVMDQPLADEWLDFEIEVEVAHIRLLY